MVELQTCRILKFNRILRDCAQARGATVKDTNYYEESTEYWIKHGNKMRRRVLSNSSFEDESGLLALAQKLIDEALDEKVEA